MQTPDKPRPENRLRTPILIIGTLIVLAMTYGSGMKAQTRTVKAINERRKLAEQDYRQAQRDLRLRLSVARQLEARRQVSLALAELDRRNFGLAQEHVKRASELLTDAGATQSSAPDLAPAADALKQVNLAAAADVSGQRQELLAVAARMDDALNPAVPEFLDVSARYDEAHPIQMPTMNDVPLPPGNDVTRTH